MLIILTSQVIDKKTESLFLLFTLSITIDYSILISTTLEGVLATVKKTENPLTL